MKPQKLSTKSNPSGENMNLQEAFNQLKKEEHNASFENLGTWLDQNSKKPNTMKNIYKIAASFIFATMILIACTVPVQQEEEIGYMIKGIAISESVNLKTKLAQYPDFDPSQLSISQIIHEQIGTGKETVERLEEVVMILPDANYKAAEDKKATLSGMFNFKSLEILPIEETVKRTIFESALHKLELRVDNKLTETEVAARINTFLHQNSNSTGDAKVLTGKDGNRFVVLEVELDQNSALETKRSIEHLAKDLTPDSNKFIGTEMSEEQVFELKKREVEKRKVLEELKKDN